MERWEKFIKSLHGEEDAYEAIEIEDEYKIAEEDKGHYILESEIELAIREMKNRKANGIDDQPVEIIKTMKEEGKIEFTKLCNEIYRKGEWPKDFLDTIIKLIQKKKNTKKV